VSDRFLRGAITVGLRRGAQLYQFRRRSVFVRTEPIWTECVTDVLGLLIGHHARLWAEYRAPVATTAEAVTRPPFELADIIRQHGDRFVETHGAARNKSASPSRLSHLVVNLDDTVREPSHGLQAEWHMPMSVSDERYTLADERRDHTDDEIVDGPFVKERRNDLAAAHHPDVLALSRPKALGEPADGLGDEFNTRWDRCRRWSAREDVVRSFCIECRAHLHAQVVGLSAKHLRVNRLHELAHAIKTLGGWTLREPLDVAIGPGDIAVCTRRDVDDDFACVRHDVPFQSWVGPEEMTDRVNVCIL
jgi:hypothetical protein